MPFNAHSLPPLALLYSYHAGPIGIFQWSSDCDDNRHRRKPTDPNRNLFLEPTDFDKFVLKMAQEERVAEIKGPGSFSYYLAPAVTPYGRISCVLWQAHAGVLNHAIGCFNIDKFPLVIRFDDVLVDSASPSDLEAWLKSADVEIDRLTKLVQLEKDEALGNASLVLESTLEELVQRREVLLAAKEELELFSPDPESQTNGRPQMQRMNLPGMEIGYIAAFEGEVCAIFVRPGALELLRKAWGMADVRLITADCREFALAASLAVDPDQSLITDDECEFMVFLEAQPLLSCFCCTSALQPRVPLLCSPLLHFSCLSPCSLCTCLL